MTIKKYIFLLLLSSCLLFALIAEESEAPQFDLKFNLGIGVDTFIENSANVTYQKLLLSPDIKFGKFGIGLDLTFHYMFTSGNLVIRPQDWVPDNPTFQNVLELYLTKFKYISWGAKGEPLFAKFGSIDDALLGNGFILGSYNNTQFLPDYRIWGFSFDLDGALFDLPIIGIETFVANVVKPDVFGLRPFVRPLGLFEIPILKDLTIGATLAFDVNPFALYPGDTAQFLTDNGLTSTDQQVFFWGVDFMQPVMANPVVSLAAFGDFASDKKQHIGGMLGFGGKLISIFNYGAQLRMIGAGFIPTYFDPYYDLIRPYKYAMLESSTPTPGYVGWLATLGTSLLDAINLNFVLDAPFGVVVPGVAGEDNPQNFAHLTGNFEIKEGLVPGLSLKATYDKILIRNIDQVFSPEGAVVSVRINYQTGPAVISFFYELKYNPETGWATSSTNVSSGFESLIKL